MINAWLVNTRSVEWYLYKGVISNRNIIANDCEYITVQYTDSNTEKLMTWKLKGEDFIAFFTTHVAEKF